MKNKKIRLSTFGISKLVHMKDIPKNDFLYNLKKVTITFLKNELLHR